MNKKDELKLLLSATLGPKKRETVSTKHIELKFYKK
jgi:hypothetical protein